MDKTGPSMTKVTGWTVSHKFTKPLLPQGKMALLNLPHALFPWKKYNGMREKCFLTNMLYIDSKNYVTYNYLVGSHNLGLPTVSSDLLLENPLLRPWELCPRATTRDCFLWGRRPVSMVAPGPTCVV